MPATIRKRDRKLEFLAIDRIIPNENNPRGRQDFTADDPEFRQLRDSIQRLGILEPIIVQPYDKDLFVLIEGERRWTVAKMLEIKEMPALIQNRLDPEEQVVVMSNIHENRKNWEMADQLRSLQRLIESKPDKSEEDLAGELGMSLGTFRDRMRVLKMGKQVVDQITRGQLDYTSALRSTQTASTLAKKRPELVKGFGGEKKVEAALIRKARRLGGISHELTAGKQDLTDREHVPDELIQEFLEKPEATLRDVRRQHRPAQQRRQVQEIQKEIGKLEGELKKFDVENLTARLPTLRKLRQALSELIAVAYSIDSRLAEAILEAETRPDAA